MQPGLAADLPLTFRPRLAPRRQATDLDFPLRWHDLRHTNASWLLAGGVNRPGVSGGLVGWLTRLA